MFLLSLIFNIFVAYSLDRRQSPRHVRVHRKAYFPSSPPPARSLDGRVGRILPLTAIPELWENSLDHSVPESSYSA